MTTDELLDGYTGHVLCAALTRIAQDHYPESWEDHAYIVNAAAVILGNGYQSLDEVPADLRSQILRENGISRN